MRCIARTLHFEFIDRVVTGQHGVRRGLISIAQSRHTVLNRFLDEQDHVADIAGRGNEIAIEGFGQRRSPV